MCGCDHTIMGYACVKFVLEFYLEGYDRVYISVVDILTKKLH